ncbi:hypothetical protein LTR78_001912 [Recurvomyces mirabilis]|uniref:Phytochrome n=1 Tax=Recurvomyces mirabilis TaxID=574656 RepID=A0AAE0WVJ2_9PEZI|nr:hypothetical protein LTR78_001912 [Recurvomyces mirabilis]KAK5156649.1 hypothetical protein LTS14_004861 [Recurvomyces mirabilis]
MSSDSDTAALHECAQETSDSTGITSESAEQPKSPRPKPAYRGPLPRPPANVADHGRTPSTSGLEDQLSPGAIDRVFPIRSVVSVDPTPTPTHRNGKQRDEYFGSVAKQRRRSMNTASSQRTQDRRYGSGAAQSQGSDSERSRARSPRAAQQAGRKVREGSTSTATTESASSDRPTPQPGNSGADQQQSLGDLMGQGNHADSERGTHCSERPTSERSHSRMSGRSGSLDEIGPLITARFKHVVTEGGHAIITGRDGETLQRCEDEPIHIPGAVQGFGLLIALEERSEGRLLVRVVSENSKRMIGYTPKQLFSLNSLTDILSEEQSDNLLDHVDFIRDEDADIISTGPEVFTISIRSPQRKNQKFWCAMHINQQNPDLIICEFELEDDPVNPLVPPNEATPEPPEDTLSSEPSQEELAESTLNISKPLRVLKSARKRKGEAAVMEVFNIMSQVQEQLAAAPNLERFLRILVGVVKELTGFHRVMIYQFDQSWSGRVVTELVDPRATKDLYKGLNFPASDIPKQARDLYKINKVRMLYDRDQETARLVCRTVEDLDTPLDLTYSYLRAMSPIHVKYLANMAVRSSMSISINAFEELWGLVSCHGYGAKGMRVSFPIRKMCRLVGDSASRNIERLSYASRLQARKLINTAPTQSNPSGYIIASSEDLLKLFDADFGLLNIRGETKILGQLDESHEALAMLEYLRMRSISNVVTSQDIKADFPDLRYGPGFTVIAGMLLVPLSAGGQDFIVFFRRGQTREVKWAGNPYEKFIKEGTEGYLEPRKSFKTWSETVVGKCRDWTEEEIETAAVLCLVYGKFIEVWRQKEAALQSSQLTKLLLANSAHEVRTPLNAIINYLEIALEGALDQETRENLAKSHSASKSLIYVINDLLDLTKTEEGGDLTRDEIFELKPMLLEATDMFKGDAVRKSISYEVVDLPGLPKEVIGDGRRVRQAISNVTANAIQNTTEGGVKVEMCLVSREERHVDVEISISDTGVGMNAKKLDALFRELEQVQSEGNQTEFAAVLPDTKQLTDGSAAADKERTLGLGLALVARIIRNMNGQLRLKSEEGKGSRFVIQFPFDLPDTEGEQKAPRAPDSSAGTVTPHADTPATPPLEGEVTLIDRNSSARRPSSADRGHMSRKNSGGSNLSRKSMGSMNSANSNLSYTSNRSNRSEADRLIDAISEPHRVEGWHHDGVERSVTRGNKGKGGSSTKPRLEKRHTTGVDAAGSPLKQRPASGEVGPQRQRPAPRPGTSAVEGQGQPIRSIRIPDGVVLSSGGTAQSAESSNADASRYADRSALPEKVDEPATADHMRVLVAEDDPVNSRIIKKRLEKLGHEVVLTVNGEECSSLYGEKSGYFDIILMDMQMPIVDGLTSTKMIRSYEKSHPTHLLSTRASLNGRLPIIAVSASLIERERQTYIDGGFDGWILKPISFPRLSEIMKGIVERKVRKENLYANGRWEKGGWFSEAQDDVFAANTKPSQKPPTGGPILKADSDAVELAAASDDPMTKEEEDSEQTREQERLDAEQGAKQEEAAMKASSLPELGSIKYKRNGGRGGDERPGSVSGSVQESEVTIRRAP